MKIDIVLVGNMLQSLQAELQLISVAIRDKGLKRFERPILLAGIVAFGSYWLLYLPPQKKLQGLQQRIDTARSMAQVSDAYKDMRKQLREIYAVLPPTKDKDHFLVEAVIESLKAEGLTSESIKPPDEYPEANMIFQRLVITAEVRFPDLVAWLARVEASRPLLHVYALDVVKSKRLGYCTTNIGIGTIVPASDVTR